MNRTIRMLAMIMSICALFAIILIPLGIILAIFVDDYFLIFSVIGLGIFVIIEIYIIFGLYLMERREKMKKEAVNEN